MGTEKRARQKANRAAKRAEEKVETAKESREQSTRRIGIYVAIAAAVIGLFVLFSLLGGDDGDDDANTIDFRPTPTAVGSDTAPEQQAELASEVPADFVAFAGTGALAEVEPAARAEVYDDAPPMTIDPTKSYGAVLNTDAGTIRLELFAADAPITVNSFVNLARDGYFDGTTFHRVLPDFMAQAGDPTGSGAGGPGYSITGEFESGRVFDSRGQVAMANPGDPNNNGSQFFITFEPTPHLDGLHTIFGQLAGDDAILDKILLRQPGTDAPATVIESVEIVEG